MLVNIHLKQKGVLAGVPYKVIQLAADWFFKNNWPITKKSQFVKFNN